MASWIAITLFAFGRNALMAALRKMTDPKLRGQLETAEGIVKAAGVLAGSLGMLYLAIAGK